MNSSPVPVSPRTPGASPSSFFPDVSLSSLDSDEDDVDGPLDRATSGSDEPDSGVMSGYEFEFVSRFLSVCRSVCGSMFRRPFVYFAQLEYGAECGAHVHLMVPVSMCGSQVIARWMKNVSRSMQTGKSNWGFTWTMAHLRNGKVRMVDVHYLFRYLLKKVAPECGGRWTSFKVFEPDQEGKVADETVKRVMEVYEMWMRECEMIRGEFESKTKKLASSPTSIKTTKRQRMCVDVMQDLVRWFVNKKVTSMQKWMKVDMDHYIKYQSYSTYRPMIKPAMEMATSILLNNGTLIDFLTGVELGRLQYNRIEDVFRRNGYDPMLAAALFFKWAKRELGKRNTILLYGPPTTGKTVIASAICHVVDPFYGNVNWNNENFPFNDCVEKMLIWWEEGRITAKNVEAAKCILGGVSCRVDRKGKESIEIRATPVIITSNLDMTAVYEGNTVNFDHKTALEDRMTCFNLRCRLEHDFGRVTSEEVYDWFAKGDLHSGRDIPDTFNFPYM
nr:replication protein [Canary dependoparvovirus 2]